MKKRLFIFSFVILLFLFFVQDAAAQCSICTRTAQQLGEKPAQGMNAGILYLAGAPFLIAGFIYYRMKKNKQAP